MSKNNIKLIIIGIFIATTSVGSLFIFNTFLQIKETSLAILDQKKNLVSSEESEKDLKEFKVIFPGIKQNIDKADALFINYEAPLDFKGFLEKTASDHQLSFKISSVSLGQEQLGQFILFQLSSTGDYQNFLKFLDKLENSQYLIKIQKLDISRGGSVGSGSLPIEPTASINASFSIKVFAKQR